MVDRKKEEFMSQIEHYRAVLNDLQKQRNEHNLKIAEIDRAIAALRILIPEEAQEALPSVNIQNKTETPVISPGKYAGMSVRWAILNLLCEDATGPMQTGDIAAALQRGGIISNADSFSSNVSAVLSNMYRIRNEVHPHGGWSITPVGRQAWAHIRAKRETTITFPAPPANVN